MLSVYTAPRISSQAAVASALGSAPNAPPSLKFDFDVESCSEEAAETFSEAILRNPRIAKLEVALWGGAGGRRAGYQLLGLVTSRSSPRSPAEGEKGKKNNYTEQN